MKTIPVSTSVTITLYSRITPFDEEGGDHDSDIDREVTRVAVTFCGALGAEIKNRERSIFCWRINRFAPNIFTHLFHWSIPL